MSYGNDTATLVIRTPGTQDRLGVPVQSETLIVKTGVSFQAMADSETVSDVDISRSTWKVFFPVDSDVLGLNPSDAIIYLGVTYEDFGDPQLWTDPDGNPHHVTVIVRKMRG